jgi:hypothetical protein
LYDVVAVAVHQDLPSLVWQEFGLGLAVRSQND